MKPLRPYQQDAIHMLRQSLAAGRRRPILQLSVGAGKTRIAAEIVTMARAKGNRVMFVVPAISLIDQTVEAFWGEGIREVGVLQGDHPLTNPNMPVQVASVQTLVRRRLPDARLVIVDEAHRRSEFLAGLMRNPSWQSVPFIGLTATPWAAGMGRDWDDLIIAATTADLIGQGYLKPFRVYAPSHPDLSAVKVVAGDYKEDDLSAVMQDTRLVADAVQTWLAKGEGRPTLVFAVDRAHARKLQEQFDAALVPAGYVDAFTPREERAALGQRLKTGELKVVVNIGTLTTGVDWPWVSCISLCRPTKSESLYVQIAGRMLRTYPGVSDAILLDHTDTALNLGLPTEIHYESLDDGAPDKSGKKRKKKAEQPKPKECGGCKALKPAGMHKCPHCGFAPQKQSTLEFAEGELAEIRRGPEDMDGTPQAERQRWHSMLVWEASARGYKPGWVNHKYAEKFGYPPGRDIDRGARAIQPDDACRRWIRSRAIAWAKGKAKGRAA